MAAIKVENAYNVTATAACDAVGAAPQLYCTTMPTHAIQAENTLKRYDPTSSTMTQFSSPVMQGKCFGCKSTSHLWMDKKGNII